MTQYPEQTQIFQEIITDINKGSVTDSATRKSKHVDITTDVTNLDIQGIITNSNVRNDWDVAALNLNHEEINTKAKNFEEARELLSLKRAHVLDKPIPNGPTNTKPKQTRISRMDCGLRGLSEEEPINILGKRGPSQITEEELKEDLARQWMKRSKTQEKYTTHATTGVMAHPC